MKVYIVFDVEREGYYYRQTVEAVFKSREEAEAYAAVTDTGDKKIEEWEVK